MPTPYVELFDIIYSSLQSIPKSPPVCRIFSANLCFIREVHILIRQTNVFTCLNTNHKIHKDRRNRRRY